MDAAAWCCSRWPGVEVAAEVAAGSVARGSRPTRVLLLFNMDLKGVPELVTAGAPASAGEGRHSSPRNSGRADAHSDQPTQRRAGTRTCRPCRTCWAGRLRNRSSSSGASAAHTAACAVPGSLEPTPAGRRKQPLARCHLNVVKLVYDNTNGPRGKLAPLWCTGSRISCPTAGTFHATANPAGNNTPQLATGARKWKRRSPSCRAA